MNSPWIFQLYDIEQGEHCTPKTPFGESGCLSDTCPVARGLAHRIDLDGTRFLDKKMMDGFAYVELTGYERQHGLR